MPLAGCGNSEDGRVRTPFSEELINKKHPHVMWMGKIICRQKIPHAEVA